MMPTLNHTPHIKKQITKFTIASLATTIVPRNNYKFIESQNDPIPQECVIQTPTLIWVKHYQYSSIHPHLQEGISFPFESFALVHNPIKLLGCQYNQDFTYTYKYAIIGAFSYMSKAPSPSNSMSTLQESLLSMLVQGTSPKHPNMVHRYVKAYHHGNTSNSISQPQWYPPHWNFGSNLID